MRKRAPQYRREYHGFIIDPPAMERGGGKIKRGADKHYRLLTYPQILQAIIRSPLWNPAPNCHMYLWVTNNYLPQGLSLMDALGFRYITNLPWTKEQRTIGYYFVGHHELCLFGTRGSGAKVRTKTRSLTTSELVGAPSPLDDSGKRIHSAKPKLTHEVVEARTIGPYAELFAREKVDGWDCWGDEIGLQLDGLPSVQSLLVCDA